MKMGRMRLGRELRQRIQECAFLCVDHPIGIRVSRMEDSRLVVL